MSDVHPMTAPMQDPLRYITYLRLVTRVFHHLEAYYDAKEKDSETNEAESMALYTEKFLATLFALRLKYRFSPEYLARPTVGLTESGFPRFYEITQLDADRSTKDERLPKLPSLEDLKDLLLDYLMTEPPKGGEAAYAEKEFRYLWQIAERAYLERLDLRTHFFAFTPGKLFPLERAETERPGPGRRSYLFSWGCYDAESSTPCVYFMLFEQDAHETPLDAKDNPDYLKFLEVIRSLAGRAPANLAAVAARLDETFRTLYPKVLKRLCIGPLVSPLLVKSIEDLSPDSLAARLQPIFERAEQTERDYALFFRAEYVTSDREVMPSGVLAAITGGKTRQIFHVPRSDRELFERGLTAANTYLLISHQFRQHILPEDLQRVPELKAARGNYLIYPEERGEIIDVG